MRQLPRLNTVATADQKATAAIVLRTGLTLNPLCARRWSLMLLPLDECVPAARGSPSGGNVVWEREARFALYRAELLAIDEEMAEKERHALDKSAQSRASGVSDPFPVFSEVGSRIDASSAECHKVAAVFAALDSHRKKPVGEDVDGEVRYQHVELREELAEAERELASVRSQFAAQTVELAACRERLAAEAESHRLEAEKSREALDAAMNEISCLQQDSRSGRQRLDAAESASAQIGALRDELLRRGRALAAARAACEEHKREARAARARTDDVERIACRKVKIAEVGQCSRDALRAAVADADAQRAEATRLRDELFAIVEDRTRTRSELLGALARVDAETAKAAASTAAAALIANKTRRRQAALHHTLAAFGKKFDSYCLQVEALLATHGLQPPLDPPDLSKFRIRPDSDSTPSVSETLQHISRCAAADDEEPHPRQAPPTPDTILHNDSRRRQCRVDGRAD